MNGSFLGIVVEVLVLLLLGVTIGYCYIVNRKLEQLRSDKSELRAIVCDLHRSTGQAERAIGVLGESANTAEQALRSGIARAEELGARLDTGLEKGEALLSKLTIVARTASKRSVEVSPTRSDREVPTGREKPAAAVRPGFRHSEMGLGLLNSQRRGTTSADDRAKDVA